MAALWRPQFERATLALIGITATPLVFAIVVTIYDKILNTLLDQWARSPGKNQVVIEAGSLRWEFGCTIAPIPQLFLEEYFDSKRDALSRGFAPAYAREWFWDRTDRNRRCYAGMRVADDVNLRRPIRQRPSK
ncbi:MAG: hypothetical protein Q9171_000239 [Xanthocarpia ochracea]